MIKNIKKHWKKILFLLIIITLYIYTNSKLVMINLPTGEYIESLSSPNNEYTLKSYKYSGGALQDWTLRVEVINNKTKEKTNIYWKYHENYAKMSWIDEETVKINNKILNIHKDFVHE